MARALLIVVAVVAFLSCKHGEGARHLPFEQIKVDHARLRTDFVGIGRFEETSAYVLADAKNTGAEPAYVTLAGNLLGDGGKPLSALRPQSIWIPAGESRTFALVDAERKPRPDAKGAKIEVHGALASSAPPPARIEQFHQFDDHGQLVVQAYVVNEADRPGNVVVLASFHDAEDRPVKRPYSVVRLDASAKQSVQFVGPPGSKRGAIYIGELAY